jgi:hypothetical protein
MEIQLFFIEDTFRSHCFAIICSGWERKKARIRLKSSIILAEIKDMRIIRYFYSAFVIKVIFFAVILGYYGPEFFEIFCYSNL